MKISTITNWAYGVTVFLTVLSGIAFMLSVKSAHDERRAVEEHLVLNELGEDLEIDAELRTDEARLYVMRGDAAHLGKFEAINAEEHRLEDKARHADEFGATKEELALLLEINSQIDTLEVLELKAVEAFRAGDADTARRILFGDEHYQHHVQLVEDVTQFREMVGARTSVALEVAKLRSDWFGLTARIMLGLTAALFLAVLYFVLRRRVALPLTRMTGIVKRLATQDYEVEVPLDDRRDEIGELNAAIHIFRENGLERERLDAERRRDLKMKDLILQMMHRLQACQKLDELSDVVSRFAPQIFPDLSGGLYVLNEQRTALKRAGSWKAPQPSLAGFSPDDCWGLRRGRAHVSHNGKEDVNCSHLADTSSAALCVPLTAQGDIIGLLSFKDLSEDATSIGEAKLYLELIAENVALAVANLQLRDRLTQLAVRDALTGLFNRRSLDQTMNDKAREKTPGRLTCLMVDIDHFKRFNDEFGHDAGDLVMQSFAGILSDTVGNRGKCYRFGGEEFVVLLPKLSREEAFDLAENIRRQAAGMTLTHRGMVLGPVTVSIGLADTPQGGGLSTLRTRADVALLKAKDAGRDRTVCEAGPDLRQVVN